MIAGSNVAMAGYNADIAGDNVVIAFRLLMVSHSSCWYCLFVSVSIVSHPAQMMSACFPLLWMACVV